MSPNPFITKLIADRFHLFNVDKDKCPCDRNERRMVNWMKKTYDELVLEHNDQSEKWGLSLGKQSNERWIMSLDFDIYDKEIGGDCEKTQTLLTEYLTNCKSDNGMYTSSTKGNMNVLVDYSNSDILKTLFAKIGANEFHKDGLEILIKGNQVIPPTQTKCKRTQKLGDARKFKIPENPFYIITDADDFTFQFIQKLCEEKLAGRKVTKTQVIIEEPGQSQVCYQQYATQDKFTELLFDVIKNEEDVNGKKKINMSNGYYFQIAGALKNNNYTFNVFEEYTNLLPNKTKTNTCNKLWNGINNPEKHMSIYVLQNIAKAINPSGYKNWLIKWDLFLHLNVLDLGENDIAKFVAPELIQTLKFCQS